MKVQDLKLQDTKVAPEGRFDQIYFTASKLRSDTRSLLSVKHFTLCCNNMQLSILLLLRLVFVLALF